MEISLIYILFRGEEGEIYRPLIYRGRCGYFPLISQSQWTAFFSTQCCSLTNRKCWASFLQKLIILIFFVCTGALEIGPTSCSSSFSVEYTYILKANPVFEPRELLNLVFVCIYLIPFEYVFVFLLIFAYRHLFVVLILICICSFCFNQNCVTAAFVFCFPNGNWGTKKTNPFCTEWPWTKISETERHFCIKI